MAKKNKRKRRTSPATPNHAGGGKKNGKNGMGFYLLLGGLGLAGVAALIFAGNGGADAPANIPLSVADVQAEASGAAGVSIGPEDAPATIIEFQDFLCGHCRQFNAVTGKLLRQTYATGDDAILRWVNYDFPLGQASWAPALAARCAEQQGGYWRMHDLLYSRTNDWIRESNPNGVFIDTAETIGLDTDAFSECLADRSLLEEIGAARKYGESLGVSGTPALYFNGRRLGTASYEAIENMILQAAARGESAEAEAGAEAEAEGSAQATG